jgi:hypothetical protein
LLGLSSVKKTNVIDRYKKKQVFFLRNFIDSQYIFLLAPIVVEILRAWAAKKSRRLKRKAGTSFIEMRKPFAANN